MPSSWNLGSSIADDHFNVAYKSWTARATSTYTDLSRAPVWCSFKGVTCGTDSESLDYRRVNSIHLPPGNLEGHFTPLGSLTEMTKFLVNGNKISGTIPQSFFNMPKLQVLNLYDNQLKGSIPPITSINSRLMALSLDDKRLEGIIPESLSKMKGFQSLTFSQNEFNGTTSSDLSGVISLIDLYLDSNSLTGTIPSTLRLLSNLRTLHLDNNKLSGTIPVLDQSSLQVIDLSVNYLTMGSLQEVPLSTFSASALAMDIVLQSNCLVFSNPSKPSQDVTATHCRGEKGSHNICCLWNHDNSFNLEHYLLYA